MITVNKSSQYSNLLIFKFSNYELKLPEDLVEVFSFSSHNGEYKETEVLNTLGKHKYKKIVVLGLGSTEEFNSVRLFKALGSAVRNLKSTFEELDILDNLEEDFGYTLGESIALSLYKYKGIKASQQDSIKLKNINFISSQEPSIMLGYNIAECINHGRELVNMPSNYATPKYIAKYCEGLAAIDCLDVKIHNGYSLEQMGMGGMLSVAKGSCLEPYLAMIQYTGDEASKEITALVGKGVTFDSGGITLKPGKGMENMISDMAGAASVISVMEALAFLKPKKNVLALIPLVENMPSGNAYKPGDVITTYSGKTIQIISTDAEGRMILCDAISYAKELGASSIIDVATLTGASANFFGGVNIAVSSNSEALTQKVVESGKAVGENFWALPNNAEYKEQLITMSADMKNTGNNSGAIVAGLFLQAFAEDVAFAHLDIAGCSGVSSPTDTYEMGAMGTPARSLLQLLRD